MHSPNDAKTERRAAPDAQAEDALELRSTADGSLTLYDPAVDQTFHSDRGAIAEARYVYLGASGAAERLAVGDALRVFEVGLGSGMNLLLTLDAAMSGGARLHYRALERRPPPAEQVRRMDLGRFLDRPELVEAWLEVLTDLRARETWAREARAREMHGREALGREAHHETGPEPERREPSLASYELPGDALLEVALGNATAGAAGPPVGPATAAMEPGWADAWYHDAFSPSASPELWSEAFLSACARALAPGGVWVSYTVAGAVRRRLQAAGLVTAKLAGPPGGKREMCRAVKPRESGSDPTAWPTR